MLTYVTYLKCIYKDITFIWTSQDDYSGMDQGNESGSLEYLRNDFHLFSLSKPFITTLSTGAVNRNIILQEGRLALTNKRLSYRPTGTPPSPRFASV